MILFARFKAGSRGAEPMAKDCGPRSKSSSPRSSASGGRSFPKKSEKRAERRASERYFGRRIGG